MIRSTGLFLGALPLLVVVFLSQGGCATKARFDLVVVPTMHRVDGDPAKISSGSAGIEIATAGNEYESAQIVLVTKDQSLKRVRVDCSDLIASEGQGRIPAAQVSFRRVGFASSKPTTKGSWEETLNGSPAKGERWADPLYEFASLEVAAKVAQPLWMTLYVPPGTAPGAYRGHLKVTTDGQGSIQLPMTVRVWDFTLPQENHLRSLFFIWDVGLASFHGVGQRDPGFGKLRQAYVTSYLQHRVSPATPAYYPLDIHYTLQRDGALTADWSLFDRHLSDAFAKGLNAFLWPGLVTINPGSGGYYGGAFIWSEAQQKMVWPSFMKENAAERTPEDEKQIRAACFEAAEHLRQKGWLDRCVAYVVGEPHKGHHEYSPDMDDFEFARKILRWTHELHPGLRTMVTDGFSPEISQDVDIWAFDASLAHEVPGLFERMEKEVQRGRKAWTYQPGLYRTDGKPAQFRIGPWFCWRYKLEGFGPFTDITAWAGYQQPNTCIVYPGKDGPIDSIRFALLRDGMEDYEYFWLLAQSTATLQTKEPASPLLAQAVRLLNDQRVIGGFDLLTKGNWALDDDGATIQTVRREIGELCDQINRRIGSRP